MDNPVLVALIAGMASAVPSIIATVSSGKANQQLNEYRFKEINSNFNELKEKVEKHNGVVERTAILEHEVAELKKHIE